jgi:hypothetical protein
MSGSPALPPRGASEEDISVAGPDSIFLLSNVRLPHEWEAQGSQPDIGEKEQTPATARSATAAPAKKG